MQYKIINGAVSYDGNMVLENIDFEINDREKIAVIGRNGCGKTTFLRRGVWFTNIDITI